jgi:prepilin signal peptidase PulO-like enzyme (type II secretory pathway)
LEVLVLAFSITPNSALLLSCALIISVIDIRQHRIPDLLLAIASFFSITLALIFDRPGILFRFLLSGGTFLAFTLFSRYIKTDFGFGDVKFISVAAFNLGLFDAWVMLTIGCILGICFALARKILKKAENIRANRIPFAPFLCLGILASLFAKPPIL